MNAPTDPSAFRSEASGRTEPDPHHFRSRFLERFTRIEDWAGQHLRAVNPQAKVPCTIGLKLEAVRKLLTTHPGLFRKAAKAEGLLEELKLYQSLRTTLAHSETTVSRTVLGSQMWSFDQPSTGAAPAWARRTTIEASESRTILGRLAELDNELRQQAPLPR